MLYNPNWNKPPIVSLEGLIAWLRSKDPNESYRFSDCDNCLFAQYMRAYGLYANDGGSSLEIWGELHRRFTLSATGRHAANPAQTFGAALERALATLTATQAA